MITAALADPLKKDISIIPCIVKFGNLKSGFNGAHHYESHVIVKNLDD